MNRLTIIGNLTKDPVMRTTQSGHNVCAFTVAVNRRQKDQNGQSVADFFQVSAWNQLAQTCQQYLAKGRKVAVVGQVSVHTYQGNDGKTYAQMDVMANDVEFLSSRSEAAEKSDQMVAQATEAMGGNVDPQSGFQQVESDNLPF